MSVSFSSADEQGNPHHLCMLTYYIPAKFEPYVRPHGNSKSTKPFHPTWPSTIEMIKKEGAHAGPKEVVSSLSHNVGGVMGAVAPGQLPRDEMQVSNAKRHLQFSEKGGVSDELLIVMQKAKADPIVRDVKTSPDPAIVVCTDSQLSDLERFCAPSLELPCSVLTVDPTFCLGDFECTPISYHHLLLVSRRYGKHPVFIGPLLIHYRKNFASFLFFASSLIGLRKSLEAIRVFGTDGEIALVDAFSHEFRFSTHLFCFNHVRNIKKELQGRKFPESDVVEIIEKIFGKLVGGVFSEGIVDAESEDEFFEKLEELKELISEREIHGSGIRTGFFDWLSQYKAENIVSGMLKPVRREAGLGNPPLRFTTNASKSVNAMLKRKVDYKKNELHVFINHLKQVVDEQEKEVERAVISRGKYKFHPDYTHLEIKESEWFKMTKDQREKHIKKFASTRLSTGSDKSLRVSSPDPPFGNASQLSLWYLAKSGRASL